MTGDGATATSSSISWAQIVQGVSPEGEGVVRRRLAGNANGFDS
jgi:hypothetical protein